MQSPAPSHPAAWLFTVVRRGAITAGRSQRRRTRHEGLQQQIKPCWFEQDSFTTLEAEQSRKALEQLNIKEREIVLAHLWGGLTFEQIAEISGGSSSTAHRRYAEGLTLLRERLNIECLNDKMRPS